MAKDLTKHEVGITIRLDWTSVKELDRISLFEREKRAVLLRRIIVEKLKVYDHNPAYKRFLKELETKMEKEANYQKQKKEGDPKWK